MLASSVLTALAIAAVFAVIGYRVLARNQRPPVPESATLMLPRDAKIVQTTVAADRIVVVIEANGTVEIRTYDLRTLKPTGQLSLSRTQNPDIGNQKSESGKQR
jgi:phosphatidylserine decarboxylase